VEELEEAQKVEEVRLLAMGTVKILSGSVFAWKSYGDRVGTTYL
jgi:hypothetical protein